MTLTIAQTVIIKEYYIKMNIRRSLDRVYNILKIRIRGRK